MSSDLLFQKRMSTTTRLTRAQMWSSLVNKIRHPEKYVGSRDVKIVADTPHYVDREMTVGPPQAAQVIKERITWDEGKGVVVFTERENDEKTGSVQNIIEEGDDGVVTVTFVFDWQWTDKANPEQVRKFIAMMEGVGDKGVKDTVKAAEEESGLDKQ